MYNVYRVSNLALWLQQINKLYLLTYFGTEVDIGVLDGFPASAKAAQHPLFYAHTYCGHGRPSQLLLSS